MAEITGCFENISVGNQTNVADKVVTLACLEPLFRNLVNAIIALSGVALFIMLIISGFNFLFSGGDQKKLEKARNTMTYAIVGLVIIASAFLIIQTIKVFTGVDVTKFTISVDNGTSNNVLHNPNNQLQNPNNVLHGPQ